MSFNLTGLTLIKDGDRLGYPWQLCIKNMAKVCDTIEVAVGNSSDDTVEQALRLTQEIRSPEIMLHLREWNMQNTGDGSELAKQANEALAHATGEWILYLQADEFIHEEDHQKLRDLIEAQPENVDQIELYRTYFWGDLQTRAPQFEIYLGRVFRNGRYSVGGDGMHIVPNRNSGSIVRSEIPIYHYSRIGDESIVTTRIRNLDQLFLDTETINQFENFTYAELSEEELVSYTGTHPEGIKEFYSGERNSNG